MSADKYAENLEKAIYNWYLGGENGNPGPALNAVYEGIHGGMNLLVPVQITGGLLEELLKRAEMKEGDQITTKTDTRLRFRSIPVNDEGEFLIPLFTSTEAMDGDHSSSTINQPLQTLIENAEHWEKCVGFVINPGERPLFLNREMLNVLRSFKLRSNISVVQASVLDMKVDAIVNAANERLLGGGGVDGAIHEAAGPRLLEACKKLSGCQTGEAKLTRAYRIKNARAIIHTVGPIYKDEETSAPLLSACYWNCLELAAKKGYGSIAFPGISTGAYGYPLDEAARVALSTIIHWLDEHQDVVMNVYLCCFKEREKAAYDKVMRGE